MSTCPRQAHGSGSTGLLRASLASPSRTSARAPVGSCGYIVSAQTSDARADGSAFPARKMSCRRHCLELSHGCPGPWSGGVARRARPDRAHSQASPQPTSSCSKRSDAVRSVPQARVTATCATAHRRGVGMARIDRCEAAAHAWAGQESGPMQIVRELRRQGPKNGARRGPIALTKLLVHQDYRPMLRQSGIGSKNRFQSSVLERAPAARLTDGSQRHGAGRCRNVPPGSCPTFFSGPLSNRAEIS
jgi:hypothetical protein